MDPVDLPTGYLLPEGKTLADVRRIDFELLASEGLDVGRLESGIDDEHDHAADE